MTTPRTDPELLANLARQVPGVIYQYRLFPDGRSCFPFASDAIREIYEVTPEEVREDAGIVFTRVHPDDIAAGIASIQHSAATLTNWEWDYRVILPRRGLRHLHGRARPERLPDGSTLWHGFISDVTDRRRTHEELTLLQAAIDNAVTGIAVAGMDGRLRYLNHAALETWGFTDPAQALGRNVREFWASGADADRVYETVLAGGVDLRVLQARRADGGTRRIQVRASRIPGPDGTPLGIIASLLDVTEAERLQEQLAQSQKMETIGRLAGGIAHDFNNLLTVMKGFLALARGSLGEGAPAGADLAEVDRAVDSAAALTQQLLAFSRRQAIAPQVLDLNESITRMRAMLERIIGEDIELRTTLDAATGRVRFDPNQMEQVLINLAVNARDAMPGGGRLSLATADVVVDAAEAEGREPPLRPGPHVELVVSDSGEGMTDAVRSHLFEPFFTTKPSGLGTGLGLAMVYGAVTQNEGRIEVDSAPGQGARFRILLPAIESAVAPRTPPSNDAIPRGTESVWVVEDDPPIRLLTTRVLQGQGYTVHAFGTGPEALDALERDGGAVDILVTDVIMPEMHGRALADAVRARRPAVRVLYVSGYTEDVIGHHGVLDPGVDFLPKPYSVAALARRVREALDRPAGP